ncbi:MAG TPA: ferritin-like domain-containing protein [Sphingomonadales bacterium]|nr:ferritin-like domain-containing protein [Sphingomonadales bacterium]
MESVASATARVLLTGNARAKAAKGITAATEWREGKLAFVFEEPLPERPVRPEKPDLLSPSRMPKRRKAGSPETRFALLHAIAHIEFNAIDLAFDMVARFGKFMPRSFTDDWIAVGAEEAGHFTLLADRLEALGGAYGDLPAHGGLWDAAEKTRDDVLARLAIVPLVLEARGLDVTPVMVENFRKQGDEPSAAILETIYSEEVGHVAKGAAWFRHVCCNRGKEPQTAFQALVRKHFPSGLKPPFNVEARGQAGMPPELYRELAKP